ncbi:MAG TPA: serine/threonine-protein kinase [Kofleriaceae bacterium]|nr:serine/threonine-protein kinase [Kofleriaceae bacterium]
MRPVTPPDDPDTLVVPVAPGRPLREPRGSEPPLPSAGTYAIGDLLGKGGMGEVVLAHDRQLGRDVALKRLRSAAPTADETARLLREARIQARLDHPAIVPVYEVARDLLGRPYFTMKRLAGATFAELLARKTAPPGRLLRALADLCRAIEAAHGCGVIHRDLKPANLVVGVHDDVYILDWGVARVLGDAALVTADLDPVEATSVLGTPGYMAPEQLDDPEVDAAADVYALGAILFELLAAEPLHPRGRPAIETTKWPSWVTSPATRRPDRQVPATLDALCVAMLARRPGARPTARRCAELLDEHLERDRELAQRRSAAIDLVWTARTAIDEERPRDALHAASRALAFDPEAPGAAELVARLVDDDGALPPPSCGRALAIAWSVAAVVLAGLAISHRDPVAGVGLVAVVACAVLGRRRVRAHREREARLASRLADIRSVISCR